MSRSLLGCLGEHAAARPDSIALVLGDKRVGYAELAARSLAAHTRIDALGLPRGARVAVHTAKSVDTVAVIVACLAARRPFLLPANDLGADVMDSLLARARCSDVLTVVADPERVTGERVHLIDCTPIDGLSVAGESPSGSPDDVCVLLTTSSPPVVVPVSFGAVEECTDWAVDRFGIGPGTSVLNYAPFSVERCLLDIRAALKVGGTTVLVEPDRATDGPYLAELLRANKIDIVQSAPTLFALLADLRPAPFTDVRHAILNGDPPPAELLDRLPALFPNATLHFDADEMFTLVTAGRG